MSDSEGQEMGVGRSNLDKELTACADIYAELQRAERLHPVWPSDPIHQAAIVSEEAGELVKAVNDMVWKGASIEDVRAEAVQVGAMAIRFLKNLEG